MADRVDQLQADLDDVYDRLELLESTLLPDGPILVSFVQFLQRDFKRIAKCFQGDGHYLDAYRLFGAARNLNKYLSFSRNELDFFINQGFAECCFQIAQCIPCVGPEECHAEAIWFTRGLEECDRVITVDPSNLTMEVLPVHSMYLLFLKGESIPPTLTAKIVTICQMISQLSEAAHTHPKIVKVKEELQLTRRTAHRTSDRSDSESSMRARVGAVGGEQVAGSSPRRSKKAKKKKGKRKGRNKSKRSRQPKTAGVPHTRGAKKKRAPKKYKIIHATNAADDDNDDDDDDDDNARGDDDNDELDQTAKHTTHNDKKKASSVADLDLVFDTLAITSSSEEESDSASWKTESEIGLAQTDLESHDPTFDIDEGINHAGGEWETVGARKSKNGPKCKPTPFRHSYRTPKSATLSATAVRNTTSHRHNREKHQPMQSTRPIQSSPSKTKLLTSTMKASLDRLLHTKPGSFTFLCNSCLSGEYPKMTPKHQTENTCNSPKRHSWSTAKVMAFLPEAKGKAPVKIRPRHKGLYGKAKMCWHATSVCRKEEKCNFAHNEIERQIWDLGRVSYDNIVAHCGSKVKHSAQINAGYRYCCTYCNVSFVKEAAFEDHINTGDHKANITSDNDRPWKYRDPPPNVTNGVYALCHSASDGTCNFSNMDPDDNPCPKAHSKEELKEWQDRHSYRRMKMQKAKMQRMFSFMDDLLAEYNFSMSEGDVMTEKDSEHVEVKLCSNDLTQHINIADHVKKKNDASTAAWNFSIKTSNGKRLKRVGLLHDTYRTHFYLSSPRNADKPQVCPGAVIAQHERDEKSIYQIAVKFESHMLGVFKQWVVFDFDEKPVVIRKLSISVGGESIQQTPSNVGQTVWNSANTTVIRCERLDKELEELEAKYKLTEFEAEIDSTGETKLNSSNFKHMMHHMLRLEEREYVERLASFKHQTTMLITNVALMESGDSTTFLPAQPGEVFGQIDITEPIFGDSEASQIALTSVQFVLLQFDASSGTVYEAEIINSQQGGLTKENIFVRLTPECIVLESLQERLKTKVDVGIQFCVDRLLFCRMHLAVDRLDPEVVFPSRNKHPALICPDPSDDSSDMNSRQKGAVRFIESSWRRRDHEEESDILLVYGPFGTGKTYTLANAVMQTIRATLGIMTKQPRVLICTHTNPAADLYITDFFDDFVKQYNGQMKMRRVIAGMRKKETISEKVQQYVLFDQNNPEKPKQLGASDLKPCHIVIATTTEAMRLAAIPDLKGHFTHILIDEAGQILEAECVTPLALADSGTCIVLAGDHLQMGPKVYSSKARQMNLHKSLLERLFEYSLHKKCRREILLTANYRTCPQILSFLSKNFYTAAEIEACGNVAVHPFWYPLEFREVFGEDQTIGTSYINAYEGQEIVKRVQELVQLWPAEWGPIFPEGIGVLTPYKQQVRLIRNQLRMAKLREIFVGRLQAVQGKQFRVVIISTVRTQNTINSQSGDYLGFLSDSKELNTALTRTRSLAIVVGDPFALCSLGDCCNVWKRYIKECSEKGSLYGDVTYRDLQRSTQKALNPHAKSFVPTGVRSHKSATLLDDRAALGLPAAYSTGYLTSGQRSTIPVETLEVDLQTPSMRGDMLSPKNPTSEGTNDDTSSEDSSEESDEEDSSQLNRKDIILQELHRQLMLDRGEVVDNTELENNANDDFPRSYRDTPLVMVEEDGHVRLDEDRRRQRKDSFQPGETLLCTFRIDREGRRYAIPKESRADIEEICISNNTHRGTALNGDEVQVQILENTDVSSAEESNQVYGKVMEVVTPLKEYCDKEIVCRADPFTDNLMVPVERHLPKIYVLRPEPSGSGKKGRSKATLVVRICRFHHRKAICVREIEVSTKERPHKLFKVQWLQWTQGFPYPLGIVTSGLPSANNLEDGLMILKHIYDVSESECDKEVIQEYPEDWVIPKDEYHKNTRTDLRKRVIFTIDPPESQDLDDALSIEELANEKSEIGVHIADVSYFVRIDSKLDEDARARATSFYPSFTEPIHMLPVQLSANLCSLHPDQERLTLSVFFTMDNRGNVDDQSIRIERSIIRSCAKLSYDEAESIISENQSDHSVEVRHRVAKLNALAVQRRKRRLQNERFSHEGTVEAANAFRAHCLVEEMMLIANEQVAKYLIKAYPECTPLRRQPNPDINRFQEWQRNNSGNIGISMSLSRRRDLLRNQCGGAAIAQNDDNDDIEDDDNQDSRPNTISVTKDIWQSIVSASTEDFTRLAGIISTDQYHPQLAPIRTALHRILQPAEYVCSGMTAAHSHGSLDMATYTHFTSPIRRYIDIVTHRQLVAAMSKKKSPAHSKEDVGEICHTCNIQAFRAREFELKARALEMAMKALSQPIQVHAFIEGISVQSFQVIFPPEILPALKNARVPYNLLKPIRSPDVEEKKRKVNIIWKERVYSMKGVQTMDQNDIRRNQRFGTRDLDTHSRFTNSIPINQWRELQEAVATEDIRKTYEVVEAVEQNLARVDPNGNRQATVQDVTCEISSDGSSGLCKQYVNFRRPFAVGDVLSVQLHPAKSRGILSPCVQLLNITPSLDLCFEHRAEPVNCFTSGAERLPDRTNLKQYKKSWLPIIEMESAYSSVSENNTIIIHCVNIEWQPQQQDRKSLPCGSFSITKEFCEARHINYEDLSTFKHAWLCLRYSSMEIQKTDRKPDDILIVANTPRSTGTKTTRVTFVAHACIPDAKLITNKQDESKDRVTIFFEVNQTSMGNFPRSLIRSRRNETKEWTVEFIPYSYPSSRLRGAVENLSNEDTPDLIQNICLLKSTTDKSARPRGVQKGDPTKLEAKRKREMKRKELMGMLKELARRRTEFSVTGTRFDPNESQREALKAAMLQDFTLIQGPPGTGKTITGAHLVYFFSLHNQNIPSPDGFRSQILYCGPSNKSVDVITAYLKSFGRTLSIVRVYSKSIEFNEFPIPGEPRPTGKMESRDVEMDPRHKYVSLHHLIRQKTNPQSEAIVEFDKKFKIPGYQPLRAEIKQYRKLVGIAEAFELNRHQVILCTCNAAGGSRIRRSTNIVQCVVDEAGMCSEPETLIPLVATNPIQVVLIGDPKQLRPIIQEPTAKLLDMEISLLERYKTQMKMLTVQYRMHELICYFPSEAFYESRLVTPGRVRRRPSPLHYPIWPGHPPHVFCHSSGPEETLSVRTEDGNEMSKANEQEAKHVVRIAIALVKTCRLDQSRIVILSQYRLQCRRILDELQANNLPDVSVRTVIKSQGSEWDFVILSTVRSLPKVEIEEKPTIGWRKKFLGFITDENQMNVALTRAKHGLIIVGNKWLLKTHKKWGELIDYYSANNSVVNARDFPNWRQRRQEQSFPPRR